MYLHFICQVERLNSTSDCRRHYILSPQNFDASAAHDEDSQYCQKLSLSRQHVEILSHPISLEAIANQREAIEELESSGHFDQQKGGVQLWLPDGPLGTLYVSLLSGTDGLGDIETLADRALQSEHLYLQFSVYLGFSKFEDNPHMTRPITFDMFCKGARMYVAKLPKVGLVRRHIP